MTINEITTLLGWCTVVNFSILIFTTIVLWFFKDFVINSHAKLTGIRPKEFPKLYFSYLGVYKIGILLLNLTPYLALKIMY